MLPLNIHLGDVLLLPTAGRCVPNKYLTQQSLRRAPVLFPRVSQLVCLSLATKAGKCQLSHTGYYLSLLMSMESPQKFSVCPSNMSC